MLDRAHGLLEPPERLRVLVLARHVRPHGEQLVEGLVVELLAGVLERSPHVVRQVEVAPVRSGQADDGDVEQSACMQAVDGRDQLLLGQVAGDAEHHEGVGAGTVWWRRWRWHGSSHGRRRAPR